MRSFVRLLGQRTRATHYLRILLIENDPMFGKSLADALSDAATYTVPNPSRHHIVKFLGISLCSRACRSSPSRKSGCAIVIIALAR